ncbi:MAG: 4'-phosphopantetheinyl transferase superfamily protein, partial [Burkholderiaceae bacterium]|nr:4'-phosphopantetheinyl transferase superfamily protein [Burkholderiaceae bacterium]
MNVRTHPQPATPFARLPGPGEVLVARCHLEVPEPALPTAMRDLDDDERSRAARFVRQRDRRRFVISHYVLRQLLSAACGVHAGQLRIAKEALGRPFLLHPSGVDFNMSHTDDAAAYAVSGHGRVGIDIETIVPTLVEELAERVLTPAELGVLRRMPGAAQASAFFRFWTAKEAFLKLHGLGFSVEPKAVVVDLDNGVVACSVPELDPVHVVWLPARGTAVCALATRSVVRIHDVSPWLARYAGLPDFENPNARQD